MPLKSGKSQVPAASLAGENKSIPHGVRFLRRFNLRPRGKEGTRFITGMMDEGAGDLDSAPFQAARQFFADRFDVA
jgi:hypothetical protein